MTSKILDDELLSPETRIALKHELREAIIVAVLDGPSDASCDRLRELEAWTVAYYETDKRRRGCISALRQSGVSWSRIGAALGISKQLAQQRYGRVEAPLL